MFEIITGVVLLVISIILIAVIMLQESKTAGMSSAISGGNDSYLGKSQGRTIDALLSKITTFCAGTFFVIVLAANLVQIFVK